MSLSTLSRAERTAALAEARETLQRVIGGLHSDVERLKQASMECEALLLTTNRYWNANLPISTLPPEILSSVFEEAVADVENVDFLFQNEWHEGRLHADELNFTISHVCHQWRTIALATPFLWSNVCAGVNTEPNALLAVLERSCTAPLTMSLDFFSLEGKGFSSWVPLNVALRYAGHARTLKIKFDSGSFALIDWPKGPTTVEHLAIFREDADVNYRRFPSLDISKVHPRLRTFHGMYINDVAKWALPSTLTKLCLFECKFRSTRLREFLQTLACLTSLQDLDLSYIATSDHSPSPIPHFPPTLLPNLRTLDFDLDDAWVFLSMLSHLSFPRFLSSLRLHLRGTANSDLLDDCITELLRTPRSSFPPLFLARLSSFRSSRDYTSVEVDGTDNEDWERVRACTLHGE